ncbi:MAG: hypothetical protein HGN29_06425 [Asgard group archaeon]|nr:hypothetical protein [Asgard group archaeon]
MFKTSCKYCGEELPYNIQTEIKNRIIFIATIVIIIDILVVISVISSNYAYRENNLSLLVNALIFTFLLSFASPITFVLGLFDLWIGLKPKQVKMSKGLSQEKSDLLVYTGMILTGISFLIILLLIPYFKIVKPFLDM